MPTVGTTFTLDEIAEDPIGRNAVLGRYTQFANLLDLAAVTVPNGFTADGRPASLTLVGPAFSDTTLARLAAAFARADPGTVTTSGGAAPPIRGGGAPTGGGEVLIAVVGRHLTGESRNAELTDLGATLAGAARTAPLYRLYRMPTPDGEGLPGLVRVASAAPDGYPIEVELWSLPASAVGGLLGGVPAPLSLGWVRLHDGRDVLGFLCEAYAAGPDAEDISAAGGWRAYRRAVRKEGSPANASCIAGDPS
ncbi:allophanate hydrolase-related protein [Micromonospora sp. NPDC003241]